MLLEHAGLLQVFFISMFAFSRYESCLFKDSNSIPLELSTSVLCKNNDEDFFIYALKLCLDIVMSASPIAPHIKVQE